MPSDFWYFVDTGPDLGNEGSWNHLVLVLRGLLITDKSLETSDINMGQNEQRMRKNSFN